MFSFTDLYALQQKLKAAPPCPAHGAQYLMICEHCEETVRCSHCPSYRCRCQDDD